LCLLGFLFSRLIGPKEVELEPLDNTTLTAQQQALSTQVSGLETRVDSLENGAKPASRWRSS
jgi:hypothetical protein